ncbi:carboxylesterase/lipase family protein [Streptacidiphilus sp. ASG 303]|uniref:carboxylesterase/lipase family protein n=1 Tax=Streptacidiphilus sp. ASG 303 TaxID=2896847 RepID=UPI001E2B77C3|nr:carboxylesterase/lipase family protein [Streptacidiphilus sp. ASG 303]MCD0485999.1 carboxylesterase/lipase family protein [Streptacidiphilus sp. ASG 303]
MRPVVTTPHGAVRGVLTEAGVAAFKGIPYAAAPYGPLRFREPQPPAPWEGVRDAADHGPTAPKAPYAAPYDRLVPEVDIPGEDCLNLSVWTPGTDGRRPVMVWLHGGAFTNGSGSVPGYDGTRFARDGVVCVTVNYRLGVEGFLHLGEGDPANLGLLDQVAALTWVRDTIGAFGGDPGQVTVFGESAGAMSIGTLLAMPRARGLFRRAVLQSGAAHHTLSPASARLVGRRLAGLLGVAPTRDALAAVPADRVVAAQQQLRAEVAARPDPELWGEAARNLMPFEPVVDGLTVPRPPADAAADGAGAEVDLLIGTNRDEFRFFLLPTGLVDAVSEPLLRRTAAGYGLDPEEAVGVYRGLRPDATPGDLMAAIATDWFYRIPAVRLAEAHARHRPGGTFLYEFAWQPPVLGGRLGACHAVELPFVFDNLHDKAFAGLVGDEPPQQLADTVHAAWVSFAATGDPGWPAYDAERRATMCFDLPSGVRDDPRPHERTLWDGRR